MKFIVELLAYGKEGEVRDVDLSCVGLTDKDTTQNILEFVYEQGQNDNQPQEHPSVSVGDVIRVNKERYLILPVGFKKLSQADYDAYKAIPRDQRAVRCYLDNAISKL